MAHVCYSLYFTDYVGEAVFGGDPTVSRFDKNHKYNYDLAVFFTYTVKIDPTDTKNIYKRCFLQTGQFGVTIDQIVVIFRLNYFL